MRLMKWTLIAVVCVGLTPFQAGAVSEVESRESAPDPMAMEARLADDPGNVELMITLANYYFDAEQWERAKFWYQEAIGIEPANPNVFTDLAIVNRNLGDTDATLVALNAALAIAPTHWQALYNKAVVLGLDLDRRADALVLLDRLDALRGEIPEIPDLQSLRESLEPAAEAEPTTEKAEDIVRLIELTGMADSVHQMFDSLIPAIRESSPNVPPEFWDEFTASVDPQELVDIVIPIYDRYLSHQDVLDLIAFYQSPAGQKIIRVQPMIMQDAVTAGQEWGKKIAGRAAEKLRGPATPAPPQS